MDAQTALEFQYQKRIGFHYYPDTLHYRYQDLKNWLPELKAMQTSWLLLIAPPDRAIPEPFLRGLIQNKIEPVLHFTETPEKLGSIQNLELLIRAYSRWGIKKIIFFDQPNLRSSWSSSSWTHKNLVDQFLDRFIPVANLALQYEITPIFPPLHPGGDYWDTVFLRSALTKIVSKDENLIDRMQMAAYSWTWGKSLNWGAGGPQVWTNNRPYSEPNEPDERGFRAFEWYNSISEDILGKTLPIYLLGSGLQSKPQASEDGGYFHSKLSDTVLSIANLLSGQKVITTQHENEQIEPVADNIVTAFYWLLCATADDPFANQSWYQAGGTQLPVVKAFQRWCAEACDRDDKTWREQRKNQVKQNAADEKAVPKQTEKTFEDGPTTGVLTAEKYMSTNSGAALPKIDLSQSMSMHKTGPSTVQNGQMPKINTQREKSTGFVRPIDHYLLLPIYEWGIADWHLEVIQPFIKKYHATVGFSIKEAALAKKVTVVGNTQSFSEELLDKLRASGCEVERIQGDGTSIASQLATR